MSATSRTPRPDGVLQEYPHPGPHGRVYGLCCGERVPGEDIRRYYRRLAHRRERLEGKRAVVREVVEMRREMELDAAEAAAEWEEYMDDLGDLGYLYADQDAYDDFYDPAVGYCPDFDEDIYSDDPNW